MGIRSLGFAFTRAIVSQLARPVYSWLRVRPWIVSAAIPTSCNCSASVSIIIVSSSHPKRVFTVTGMSDTFTIAETIASSFGTSRSIPAPAPRPAIFFTGQPKFKSSTSGRTDRIILAPSTMLSMSCPYSCTPTGRSASRILSFASELPAPCSRPSEFTNSVYTMSAP